MHDEEAIWYLSQDGSQPAGPYTSDQVASQLRGGQWAPHASCWCEGAAAWQPLAETEPFKSAILATLPPPAASLIHFHCPCGSAMAMSPEYAGRTAQCTTCGQVVVVPDAEGTRSDAPPPTTPRTDTQSAPHSTPAPSIPATPEENDTGRERVRGGKRLIVPCLAALVIICAVAAYFVMRTPPEIIEARKSIDAGQYRTAGESLVQFLADHPDHPEAHYLLGLAIAKLFAAEGAPGASETHAMLEAARNNIALSFISDKWRQAARDELKNATGATVDGKQEGAHRAHMLSKLRRDLDLAGDQELADELLVVLRGLKDRSSNVHALYALVQQLLTWKPAAAGDVFETMLPERAPSQQNVEQVVGLVSSCCRESSEGNMSLAGALVKSADQFAKSRRYEPALAAYAHAGKVNPDAANEILVKWLDCLGKLAAAGNSQAEQAKTMLDRCPFKLDSAKSETAKVYMLIASHIEEAKSAAAADAVRRAIELDSDLADTEEATRLLIRFTPNPSDDKLGRCRTFLSNWPESKHRTAVLITIVKDALVVARQYGRFQREKADPHLADATSASHELLELNPPPEGMDEAVFELASTLADRGKWAEAIDVNQRLTARYPKSPLKEDIENKTEKWCLEWAGNLDRELIPEFKRITKQLIVKRLAAQSEIDGCLRALEGVHVLHVLDECTASSFNSQQIEMLKAWVANGGILWCTNDVLSFFNITYVTPERGWNQPRQTNCEIGAVCYITNTTGCECVVLNTSTQSAFKLHSNSVKAIPLLLAIRSETADRDSMWSLVPHEKGWIADVKEVDVRQRDGATFWLWFRLFCLNWRERTNEQVRSMEEVARGNFELKEPGGCKGATAPLAPRLVKLPDPTIVDSKELLQQVLESIDMQRVIWIQLDAKDAEEAIGTLRGWVHEGGVLWVDTDLALAFGFKVRNLPSNERFGTAGVVNPRHPIFQNLSVRKVDYELSEAGTVVRDSPNTFSLLGQGKGASAYCVCAIRALNKGQVIFRPRKFGQVEGEDPFSREFYVYSFENAPKIEEPKDNAENQPRR